MFDAQEKAKEWTKWHAEAMRRMEVALTRAELIISERAFQAGVEAARKELGADELRHIAEVRPDGSWVVQHPLAERVEHDLFTCPFNNLYLDTEGLAVGRYHLEMPNGLGGNLKWTPVE